MAIEFWPVEEVLLGMALGDWRKALGVGAGGLREEEYMVAWSVFPLPPARVCVGEAGKGQVGRGTVYRSTVSLSLSADVGVNCVTS